MKNWFKNHAPLAIALTVLLTVGAAVALSVAITTKLIGELPAGPQGEPGVAGVTGADGAVGKNGLDGKDGVDGKDGANGKDGADGAVGADGANGKSAYEIALDYGFEGTEMEWLASLKGGVSEAADKGYIIVTDHVIANTGIDLSDALQTLIDENPNKTLYFPDGEYTIAKPIATSANPVNAVSFRLSNFAVIKAADTWDSSEAMIRLGAAESGNDITTNGSNYSFIGGIVDGNGVAKGIAVESGLETSIRNVSIKHTQVGLHIKNGANNGSSGVDVETVNIVGNNSNDAIGVLVEGRDNTLAHMRIASVKIGVQLENDANYLTDIHPLFIYGGEATYTGSIAFKDISGNNRFFRCYSDQFQTCFYVGEGSIYDTCYGYWYNHNTDEEIGFMVSGPLNATITNASITLGSKSGQNSFIVCEAGGNGVILYPRFDEKVNTSDAYKAYLDGRVLP